MAQALAWRDMRFELSDATLEDAVRLFNRKGGVQLELADRDLGARRLSGIYWANNPEQLAELLAGVHNLKVERAASGRIRLSKP